MMSNTRRECTTFVLLQTFRHVLISITVICVQLCILFKVTTLPSALKGSWHDWKLNRKTEKSVPYSPKNTVLNKFLKCSFIGIPTQKYIFIFMNINITHREPWNTISKMMNSMFLKSSCTTLPEFVLIASHGQSSRHYCLSGACRQTDRTRRLTVNPCKLLIHV